jgi:acetyl esterase/lipase
MVAHTKLATYAACNEDQERREMPARLDPVVEKIIPLLPLRDPAVMTPSSAREALRALAASRAHVPPPPVASAEDSKVKGAAGFLAARVYRMGAEKAPTVVFFHGGGWVAGDLETHDRQARYLAIETGAVVVSVDYRRPPEVRFPGAFEDAVAALRDVVARIAEFGNDPTRIGVAGDSAGGNLAATAAIAARDAGIRLAGQLLVYPATDLLGNFADESENERFPSRSENAEGYFLSRAVMEWFCRHYLADKADGSDWRASPLRAKNLAGVAPAVITTAWFDPLRDEGALYADALVHAGVHVKYHPGEGLIHGYFGLVDASDVARAEAQRARADFKAMLDKGAS